MLHDLRVMFAKISNFKKIVISTNRANITNKYNFTLKAYQNTQCLMHYTVFKIKKLHKTQLNFFYTIF